MKKVETLEDLKKQTFTLSFDELKEWIKQIKSEAIGTDESESWCIFALYTKKQVDSSKLRLKHHNERARLTKRF